MLVVSTFAKTVDSHKANKYVLYYNNLVVAKLQDYLQS